MKKHSIENRRYLDRLAREDPKRRAKYRYSQRRSSAKSFIKKHLKKEDIPDFQQTLKEREQALK